MLGSGAAALAAAVTAAEEGLSTLVLERALLLGGTSAISGAAAWIPGTRQAIASGFDDTPQKVRLYLKSLLGNHYNSELIEAFLTRGPEALAFLEDHSELKYSVRDLSPDYYPELPGHTDNGRVLEIAEYDGRKLGDYFELLRPPLNGLVLFGGLMLSRMDVHHFLNMKKSPRSLLHCGKLMARFLKDRIRYSRGTRLVIGAAMMARLLRSCLDKGVKFQIGAETQGLLVAEGRVQGVTVRLPDGRTVKLTARHGVILGTGGISRRPNVLQDRPGTREDHISLAAPHADGSGIAMALKLGARLGENMTSNFHWFPMSQMTRPDGSTEIFPHIVTDRAKPGIIAVNDKGARFVNEANSYHRFVTAMLAQQREGTRHFHLIADAPALKAYGLGLARPSPGNNSALVKNGYLIRENTLAGLARRMDVDPRVLEATIAAYNRDAVAGRDTQFHKGDSSYNKAMGDAHAPNPCLAPVKTAPFYAVRIHTGDAGSARGLVTDACARVLNADDTPLAGLYAVGNDMNSLWAGEYPGPGITLGPGLVFGYVAAKTIAGAR